MGVETEYGLVPGDSRVTDPSVLSALLVTAYARAVDSGRGRWNYGDESPLRDLRGFEIARSDAPPDTYADDDPGTVNAVLTNGARFYVDHAHPEYSAPETTTPRGALVFDKAGEVVLRRAAAEVLLQGGPPITLYKNNTDGKGASYGTHENFLLRRSTPLSSVVTGLTPFLVSRQVFCGAGRVGPRSHRRHSGLPALVTGRLHRSRGRAGDHRSTPDRQHPRRTARRCAPLAPPAPHHR